MRSWDAILCFGVGAMSAAGILLGPELSRQFREQSKASAPVVHKVCEAPFTHTPWVPIKSYTATSDSYMTNCDVFNQMYLDSYMNGDLVRISGNQANEMWLAHRDPKELEQELRQSGWWDDAKHCPKGFPTISNTSTNININENR